MFKNRRSHFFGVNLELSWNDDALIRLDGLLSAGGNLNLLLIGQPTNQDEHRKVPGTSHNCMITLIPELFMACFTTVILFRITLILIKFTFRGKIIFTTMKIEPDITKTKRYCPKKDKNPQIEVGT